MTSSRILKYGVSEMELDDTPIERLDLDKAKALLTVLMRKGKLQGDHLGLHRNWCSACQGIYETQQRIAKLEAEALRTPPIPEGTGIRAGELL